MELPISLFLGLFGIALLFWLLFSFFGVYHAAKFGMATKVNKSALTVYLLGTLFFVIVAFSIVVTVDWSQTIQIF